MVLRIEYLLFLGLLLLILSIWGIHPSSQSAIEATGDKEILFQNFSLIEVKEKEIGQKLFASETIKYTTHLDFKEINLSDEFGHNIQAKEGVYKDDIIVMKEHIRLTRIDGLSFSTEYLTYNLKTKKMDTLSPFILKLNESSIKGSNLKFDMNGKEIRADKIEAHIYLTQE
jgi:LPS export ABC transporter protein LptC